MSHSSDDPTSDRVSPVPPALPAASGESEPANTAHLQHPEEAVKESADPQAGTAVSGDLPRRPRRRRRRRAPGEAGDAPARGELSAGPQGGGDPSRRRRRRHRGTRSEMGTAEPAPGGEVQAVEGAPVHAPDAAPHQASPTDEEGGLGVVASRDGKVRAHFGRRRRRSKIPAASTSLGDTTGEGSSVERSSPATGGLAQNVGAGIEPQIGRPGSQRRRRRFPRSPAATPSGEHQAAGRSSDEGSPLSAPRNRTGAHRDVRGPGSRGRDDRRAPRQAEQGERRPQEPASTRPGNRERASSGRRDRQERSAGPRGRGGRDVPQSRPEPRLYALESVVDRGFEDVPDDTDGAIRRVHWTITKRTVADQQSGKPMTTTYVLKRDGVDTEFPSLGTARAAANKTIVHPEKLTLSKAEHAAARK
jgi:hypothetical protein